MALRARSSNPTTGWVSTLGWSPGFLLLAMLAPAAPSWAVDPPLAAADASAHYQDSSVPSLVVTDPNFADQSAIVPGPAQGTFAIANGTGIVSDPLFGPSVDGFSEVLGVGSFPNQTDDTLRASSLAQITTNWTVMADPNDPPGPIDVDLDLFLDGALEVGNFFSSNLDDVFAEVMFRAWVQAPGDLTLTEVFNGEATLNGSFLGDVLTTSGDLMAGDFTAGTPGSFSSTRSETNLMRTLEDVLTLSDGDVFAVTLLLYTDAFAAGPFEAHALSNFDTTGSFALGSDTPGVSFAQVPEPGTAVLLLSGLLAIAGRRRTR